VSVTSLPYIDTCFY